MEGGGREVEEDHGGCSGRVRDEEHNTERVERQDGGAKKTRIRSENCSARETLQMLQLRRANVQNSTAKGSDAWKLIAQQLGDMNPESQARSAKQVSQRWDTLVKVYVSIEEECRKSGRTYGEVIDERQKRCKGDYIQLWHELIAQGNPGKRRSSSKAAVQADEAPGNLANDIGTQAPAASLSPGASQAVMTHVLKFAEIAKPLLDTIKVANNVLDLVHESFVTGSKRELEHDRGLGTTSSVSGLEKKRAEVMSKVARVTLATADAMQRMSEASATSKFLLEVDKDWSMVNQRLSAISLGLPASWSTHDHHNNSIQHTLSLTSPATSTGTFAGLSDVVPLSPGFSDVMPFSPVSVGTSAAMDDLDVFLSRQGTEAHESFVTGSKRELEHDRGLGTTSSVSGLEKKRAEMMSKVARATQSTADTMQRMSEASATSKSFLLEVDKKDWSMVNQRLSAMSLGLPVISVHGSTREEAGEHARIPNMQITQPPGAGLSDVVPLSPGFSDVMPFSPVSVGTSAAMDDLDVFLSRQGTEAGTNHAVMEHSDVFLSHHRHDVKATFVAHLEDALRRADFRPFLDARSLMKGNPALQSIDQAVAMAKVHIAVVSKGYAESKYCLNELVAMLRSGKPVIPVFYDVEPVDLRWVENGPFAEAFERHKSRGRTEKKLQEWTDALGALAGITGFCLAHYRRDEADLKQEVVNAVARLTPSNQPVEVEPYRVGLEGPANLCMLKLDNMGAGVGILGLVGVGGVGKTTLAREIYNRFVAAKKFRCMTFLEIDRDPLTPNVRPTWDKEAPDSYKDLAKDVVGACGGLPLALKEIGSSLYDRRLDGDLESKWLEARDALRQNSDVVSVLQWSYDSLSKQENLMFMDITCLFYKESVKQALAYWKSCKGCTSCGGILRVDTSLQNLVDKNMVRFDGSGAYFEMHDLLIELGQEIGMQVGTHFVKDGFAEATLVKKQKLLKTIALNLGGSRKRKFETGDFEHMPNLHYLVLPDGCIVCGNYNRMPREI